LFIKINLEGPIFVKNLFCEGFRKKIYFREGPIFVKNLFRDGPIFVKNLFCDGPIFVKNFVLGFKAKF